MKKLSAGDRDKITCALLEVHVELERATEKCRPMASAHEGYAVILEEMDELKEHVWSKPSKRDLLAMREEAIQVAAMAVRFMIDVCRGGN